MRHPSCSLPEKPQTNAFLIYNYLLGRINAGIDYIGTAHRQIELLIVILVTSAA